jgi:hypothetical protein
MKVVQKNDEYVIFEKRSGRYAVKDLKTRKYLLAEDKIQKLTDAGLVKKPAPKPKAEVKEEAPAEETAAEEATEE